MAPFNPSSKPPRPSRPAKVIDHSSGSPAPRGPKLRQIQYRSYQHTITIYHFNTLFKSVHQFRALLRRTEHGYVDTLIGVDTLARYQFILTGDEVPAHRVEVAYLPNVFRNYFGAYGSALGFRSEEGVVEWMCFERCIKSLILDAWVCEENEEEEGGYDVRVEKDVDKNDARRMFDPVATLDKGILKRAVRGAHEEHRRWHGSLWGAEARNVRVALRLKGDGEGFRRGVEGVDEEKIGEESEMWQGQQQGDEVEVGARAEAENDDQMPEEDWNHFIGEKALGAQELSRNKASEDKEVQDPSSAFALLNLC